MKNKTHLIAVFLLAGSMLLAGCKGSPSDQTEKTTDTEAASTESEDTLATESDTPDYTNLVTDAFNENISVEVYSSLSKCSFRVPVINRDGSEIDALNEEIYNKYSAYYTNVKENGEQGWSECSGCDYTWSVTDDILTLIMTASLYPDASGWDEPEVFSVDLKNQKVLDKQDIADYFELTQEEYDQKVKDAMGNYFCNSLEDAFNSNPSLFQDDFTKQQLANTVSQDNIDYAVPYITEDGNMGINARIYSIAGGDYYPQLIDTETVKESKWYTGVAVSENGSSAHIGSSESSEASDPNTTGGVMSNSSDTSSDEYILADSNSRYLDASDIAGMSSSQIQMAINEIYARHGRIFIDSDVRNYFEGKSWYNGTIEPAQFDDAVFNQYEAANIEFLSSCK